MKLSDRTNKNGIVQHIERETGLGDGIIDTGSTTDQLRFFVSDINRYYMQYYFRLINGNPDIDPDDPAWGDLSSGTFPLSANRALELPTSEKIVKYKRVDITYDGTNWNKATLFDSLSHGDGLGNETHEDARFSTSAPYYDPKGNSLLIYPKATAAQVSAGAKARLEWVREPEEFLATGTYTDGATTWSDKEPCFDEAFHPLLYLKPSLKYLERKKPKATQILGMKEQIKELEDLFDKHYGLKNEDTPITIGTLDTINDYS